MFSKKALIVSILLTTSLLLPKKSQAEAGREFLLSCTYGVLAGALLGAASLAVEENPSEKVHRVARGASLGLYAGIILGTYVVYIVPSQNQSSEKEELEQYQEKIEPDDYGKLMKKFEPPKLTFYPVIEQSHVTGVAFNYNIARF
jgi:hypothetical protein